MSDIAPAMRALQAARSCWEMADLRARGNPQSQWLAREALAHLKAFQAASAAFVLATEPQPNKENSRV